MGGEVGSWASGGDGCWPGAGASLMLTRPGNRWSSSLRETSRVSPSPNSPGPFTLDQLVSPSCSKPEPWERGRGPWAGKAEEEEVREDDSVPSPLEAWGHLGLSHSPF